MQLYNHVKRLYAYSTNLKSVPRTFEWYSQIIYICFLFFYPCPKRQILDSSTLKEFAESVTHMLFHGFLTPVLTQLSFQSHQLHFSHTLAEVRGENMPERKFASIESWTHNHQVMSPKRSPLSHPGRAYCIKSGLWLQKASKETLVWKVHEQLLILFYRSFTSKTLTRHNVFYQTNLTCYLIYQC